MSLSLSVGRLSQGYIWRALYSLEILASRSSFSFSKVVFFAVKSYASANEINSLMIGDYVAVRFFNELFSF